MYALSTENHKINVNQQKISGHSGRNNHKLRSFNKLFFLLMSRLSQEQYNIAISMLVNGSSINPVAKYFNVHPNTISRLQTRFTILGLFVIIKEVANYVSQLLRKIVIFIPCNLRNCFRNAALKSRSIPGMRPITGQTIRNRLCEINPVPTGLQ